MIEHQAPMQIPERSRLFALPIEGQRDVDQESILDYAQRLSLAHSVRIRDMFSQVILPEARLTGAFFVQGHFSARALRGCSGWSDYARRFSTAMQRLTGRADVVKGCMVAWGEVLSPKGYAATVRRWCPICLKEQRPRGFHTFSLLWSIEAVVVCPVHAVRLCANCHRCGSTQPLIGELFISGRCHQCGVNLCEANAEVIHRKRRNVDLFRANSVAGMIRLHRIRSSLINEQSYRRRLEKVAEAESGGSLCRLEQKLNLSYGLLRRKGKPSLALFLEVMHRLGVEPLAFLEETRLASPVLRVTKAPFRAQRRRSPDEHDAISAVLQERLERALGDDSRLTSRLELIRCSGISNSFLATNHPQIVHALRCHNDAIRLVIHEKRLKEKRQQISACVERLVIAREPLTAKTVSEALVSIGFHRRDPEARRIVNDALKSISDAIPFAKEVNA